jgi:hypothetical protein
MLACGTRKRGQALSFGRNEVCLNNYNGVFVENARLFGVRLLLSSAFLAGGLIGVQVQTISGA